MGKIRTSSQIRTHRGIRSFRSSINATGIAQIFSDLGRVQQEELRLKNRQSQASVRNKIQIKPCRSIM